jgi:hypothetical protein
MSRNESDGEFSGRVTEASASEAKKISRYIDEGKEYILRLFLKHKILTGILLFAQPLKMTIATLLTSTDAQRLRRFFGCFSDPRIRKDDRKATPQNDDFSIFACYNIESIITTKKSLAAVRRRGFSENRIIFYGVSLARVTNKVNPTTPSYSDAPKNGEAKNTAATKTAAEANPA